MAEYYLRGVIFLGIDFLVDEVTLTKLTTNRYWTRAMGREHETYIGNGTLIKLDQDKI